MQWPKPTLGQNFESTKNVIEQEIIAHSLIIEGAHNMLMGFWCVAKKN